MAVLYGISTPITKNQGTARKRQELLSVGFSECQELAAARVQLPGFLSSWGHINPILLGELSRKSQLLGDSSARTEGNLSKRCQKNQNM